MLDRTERRTDLRKYPQTVSIVQWEFEAIEKMLPAARIAGIYALSATRRGALIARTSNVCKFPIKHGRAGMADSLDPMSGEFLQLLI